MSTLVQDADAHSNESLLFELENLIRDILATPTEEADSEIVALVRGAVRTQPRFVVHVVLRALRLDQRLRKTQREVIQLQWKLAQLRRGSMQCRAASEDAD